MTVLPDPVAVREESAAEKTAMKILAGLDAERSAVATERLQLLVTTLGGRPSDDLATLVREVAGLLADTAPDRVWLARAVIGARLPTLEQMGTILRTARLWGPWSVLVPGLRALREASSPSSVRVVAGQVTCDVHSTAETDFVSGIQRVVRSATVRWHRDHDVQLLGWTPKLDALRPLTDVERGRVLGAGEPRAGQQQQQEQQEQQEQVVVVPWRGVHLVPELPTGAPRVSRIAAIGRYSGSRVGVIGYDVIPLTTSTSVAPGMVAAFTHYLSACREVYRIAAISGAAGGEYEGWRRMLAGVRAPGPEVGVATLPVVAQAPSEQAMERARRTLGMTSVPMVLVVGSHEPRKNHLAVLHAAELLWREGLRFTLTFVGAGAWRTEAFEAGVAKLRAAGRAIRTIRGLPDDELWAALRLAHCTLFPSLNEGFGLPVAESLAAGTPVITSDYGSTRDIVAPDGVALGGLLVDPRDDHAIVDALRTMLGDAATYQRLRAQTSQHQLGSWDDYAHQVWQFLVGSAD